MVLLVEPILVPMAVQAEQPMVVLEEVIGTTTPHVTVLITVQDIVPITVQDIVPIIVLITVVDIVVVLVMVTDLDMVTDQQEDILEPVRQ